MLALVAIDYKEFKKEIYSHYVKLFPKTVWYLSRISKSTVWF